MKRTSRIAFAIVGIMVIVGFSWAAVRSLNNGASITNSALIGKPVPGESLFDIETAEKISLNSPGNIVVINFWAPWCAPCASEHRMLNDAVARYAQQNVRFVGVAYQSENGAVTRFLDANGHAVRTLLDPDGKAAIDFGVTGPPETFFIDGSGVVRARVAGAMSTALLDDILTKLANGTTDLSKIELNS